MLYLVTSGLMLLLLILIGVWVGRQRSRDSSMLGGTFLHPAEEDADPFDAVEDIMASPITWFVAFIALVVVALGSAMLFLTETDIPASTFMWVFFGTLIVALVGFLGYGTYTTARSRGHSSALSIMEGLVVIGALSILGVIVHLMFLS